MDRKDFLKGLGLVGIGAILPKFGIANVKDAMDEPSNDELLRKADACTTAPSETAGPYPAPSTLTTSSLVRQDITEGTQTGIPLTLTLTIVNADNSCLPVSGLRVDIWHCNKRGYYSAYDGQPGIDGTVNNAGTTWLRGIQYTDANGQVTFTTIYPGWYTPRATHIHVQVFNGTTQLVTTQLAFPDATNTTVNSFYATSGTNSFTNTNDMVFSDSYADELMTVSGSTSTSYTATKTIAVSAGALGVGTIEAQTGGQFSRLSNYPNPFAESTTISFELLQTSDVELTVLDMGGRVVEKIIQNGMNAGKNTIPLQLGSRLAAGEYMYQLQVSNHSGTFRQSKPMIKK